MDGATGKNKVVKEDAKKKKKDEKKAKKEMKKKERNDEEISHPPPSPEELAAIPIIAGMGEPSGKGRKISVAEKEKTDRTVVKSILKDMVKQENMDQVNGFLGM